MELGDLLAANFEDPCDPTCMEKILMYHDQLQAENDDFMELLIDKLNGEVVSWPQPWYQCSNSLTRPLENQGENGTKRYKTDSINKEESEKIAKNWKKFKKKFKIPDKPECFARWRNRNKTKSPKGQVEQVRHFVIAFLAQGLERNLYQVYQYFVTHYGAPVKGAYSAIEEKIMEICFIHKPENAVPFLSAVLGREPRGILKKLSRFYNGHLERKKGRLKMTLQSATKLLKSLLQHTELPLEKLKYAHFDKSVWLKVQEDMGHYYVPLYKFWYQTLHVQIFVKHDVKLHRLRKKILKKLRSRYIVWTDIRWKEVTKIFPDGFTHTFLYKVVWSIACQYPGNYRTAPLEDVIKFSLDKLKAMKMKRKKGEKRLRTLTINKEGNLERVIYNTELP